MKYNELEELETIDEAEPIEDQEESAMGEVTGCKQLNVRSEPSLTAAIVSVINEGAEVIIDDSGSTEEFYKICTATSVEGYCLKQFIAV